MEGGTACRLLFSLLFFLLLLPHLPAALSQSLATGSPVATVQIGYSSFPIVNNNTDLILFQGAGYSQEALQITPDTSNNVNSFLANKTGRVFLTRRFKVWEDLPAPANSSGNASATATRHVASFNTTIRVNIYRPSGDTPGEGLAFLIAPALEPPPPGSYGGYLGLTNSTTDGDPGNHFVAVELDTVKEDFDPNSNHVGIDVNSVNSTATANLTDIGIEIAPVNGTNHTMWVDYDGAARRIWIYVALDGDPKPSTPALSAPLDLGEVLLQYSYFGFAASTGDHYELNCVLSWNLTVEKLDDGEGGRKFPAWKLGVIVGVAAAATAAILLVVVLGLHIRRKKVGDGPSLLMAGTLKSLPGMPREFEFRELRKATNNFDGKMRLGQGGFGVVYRGVLVGENRVVAVKQFSRGNHGQDDFLKELTIINRLRHKHLVPLVGWCHNKGMLLLVYEYMPNGSLDQHLYSSGGEGGGSPLLGWERRYNIVAGVASALHYLHDEYDQRVVHRDLKASNVMLDAAFNARLGDFGLARALDTDKTSYAEIELGGVPGTLGYIAPECFHTGKATRQSDVFGFGAVVLEVVSGRRPRSDVPGAQFLADWVWKLHGEGRILDAVDPRLAGEFDKDDASRLLLLGLACSHPIPGERPRAEAVVQILSRSVPTPEVPLQKPAFMWPAGPVDDDDDDASGRGLSRSTVSMSCMTSFNYASSSGYNSQLHIREGPRAAQPAPDL